MSRKEIFICFYFSLTDIERGAETQRALSELGFGHRSSLCMQATTGAQSLHLLFPYLIKNPQKFCFSQIFHGNGEN